MSAFIKTLTLLFVGTIMLTSSSLGQPQFDKTGTVRNQVAQLIRSRYGDGYRFSYTMFDARIADSKSDDFQNPYGTLSGCVLFSAYRYDSVSFTSPDTFIVGMVRNGGIVWDNFAGSTMDLEGSILDGGLKFSQDINNDGEVDLVYLDNVGNPAAGVNSAMTFIHILSWNGSTGHIISSTMLGTADCELVDTSSNGIMEIRTKIPDVEGYDEFKTSTYPYVTYGWNGTQYGLWPGVTQVPKSRFLPANRFNASVRCVVNKTNGMFTYSYMVFSDPQSRQKIDWVSIGGIKDTSGSYAPPSWSSGTSILGGRRFDVDFSNAKAMISPGQTLSGLQTRTAAPPTIVKYYLRGKHPSACCPTQEERRQDLLTNSVTGFTLGTRDTSSSVNTFGMCDKLSSYTIQSRSFGWIKDQVTANKYLSYFNSARTSLQQNNVSAARATLMQVLSDANVDSTNNITSEAYALIRYNTEYLLSQLPLVPPSGMAVRLINSGGASLPGGSLQYYESSWKDAINNNDGTFTVNTTQTTTSLRMTYAYGSQTKSNVPVNGGPVTFQTVNTQVKLQNSQGMAIDTGSVQYFAGAWRSFGTTTNGTASMELLPATYSFRMTYAYGSNDKQQDIGANSTLVFQTVNASVQLQNSQGTPMDQGTVQYYAGAWRDFGSTTNGVATKELLPANYSFRMTYAYASKDKQQNIGTNPTIVFSTVNATVQLKNSLGNLIDQGTVQYYAGAWRSFGTTTNGSATKELLPNNYSFRLTNEFVSNDKQQDIGTNSTVGFSTVLCTVRVSNTAGQLLSGAVVSYYSGAWRQIGTTVDGQITKELLPANLSFRASYGGKSQDKAQNLSTNALVEVILP